MIEQDHPGYLHYLFRRSIESKGNDATFSEIATQMNIVSRINSEERPNINIDRFQLSTWFTNNKGKLLSPMEKPLDSREHCKKRIDWVIKYYGLLTCKYAPVCFIDEKWFYRVNRRRSIKMLPKGKHEDEKKKNNVKGKMLSRRFPIKTMFMGVVARPLPHRNFSGKIYMKQVSTTKYLQTATAHTNFSDDALVNDAIKSKEWKTLVSQAENKIEDLIVFLEHTYHLDEYITERLEFYYETKIGNAGNTKKIVMDDDVTYEDCDIRTETDKSVPTRKVTIQDVNVQVRNRVGDEVQEDCTCDSEYMLTAMKDVGESIRSAYHWIPVTQKCYLVMDNAGGHGTSRAIIQYTDMLVNKYNIEIIFQIPRSPYTNVLDLGVWMSIQSIVERRHYLKRATSKALVNTVNDTWNSSNLDIVLSRVFNRLKVVLCNILRDEGGNNLVEENRGVSSRDIKIESVMRELECSQQDIDNLQMFNKQNEAVNLEEEITFDAEHI